MGRFSFYKNDVCKAPTLSYNELQRGEGPPGRFYVVRFLPAVPREVAWLACSRSSRYVTSLVDYLGHLAESTFSF
jgi:hypothetical protein